MASPKPRQARPAKLRKETREWLTNKTIPNVRGIAKDLENAGEDVTDLLQAIDELEAILRDGPERVPRRTPAKAKA